MKVYEVVTEKQSDGNDVFCRFDVVTKADRWTLNESFKGKPFPLEKWVPFKIMRSPTTPGNLTKSLGDRAGIDFKMQPMVLSRRALDVLLPNICEFGEVLPLEFSEAEYSLFNVTNVIDALDVDACEIIRYPDGGISEITRHAFRPKALQNQWIFKIPQKSRQAFVTDHFMKLVQDAKLTGFDFEELWSDEVEPKVVVG